MGPRIETVLLKLILALHRFQVILQLFFIVIVNRNLEHLWLYQDSNFVYREGNGTPLQCSCLENPMDGGAWWAAVHGSLRVRHDWGASFTFNFHALEKDMATHSSVLAWRIPGTGEPDGLPSMGSQSRTRLKWLSSSSNLV